MFDLQQLLGRLAGSQGEAAGDQERRLRLRLQVVDDSQGRVLHTSSYAIDPSPGEGAGAADAAHVHCQAVRALLLSGDSRTHQPRPSAGAGADPVPSASAGPSAGFGPGLSASAGCGSAFNASTVFGPDPSGAGGLDEGAPGAAPGSGELGALAGAGFHLPRAEQAAGSVQESGGGDMGQRQQPGLQQWRSQQEQQARLLQGPLDALDGDAAAAALAGLQPRAPKGGRCGDAWPQAAGADDGSAGDTPGEAATAAAAAAAAAAATAAVTAGHGAGLRRPKRGRAGAGEADPTLGAPGNDRDGPWGGSGAAQHARHKPWAGLGSGTGVTALGRDARDFLDVSVRAKWATAAAAAAAATASDQVPPWAAGQSHWSLPGGGALGAGLAGMPGLRAALQQPRQAFGAAGSGPPGAPAAAAARQPALPSPTSTCGAAPSVLAQLGAQVAPAAAPLLPHSGGLGPVASLALRLLLHQRGLDLPGYGQQAQPSEQQRQAQQPQGQQPHQPLLPALLSAAPQQQPVQLPGLTGPLGGLPGRQPPLCGGLPVLPGPFTGA